ncbi:MAG: sporulation protein YqfD [Clostridia bacterium]|nr:sporulation protein YqfD [Clostridia bacterium]
MRVLQWFPGWVRVEAEGGYPERLLNELTMAGVPVWRVHRRQEWVRFSCLAKDYRRMRPFARRACVRMRTRQKHGLPFWAHRYRHRRGLAVAVVIYGLLLALLAPRIWVVQVAGNAETSSQAILDEVSKVGVRVGAPMERIDIKALQISGPDSLSGVSFITVNPRGCVARVEVTERVPAPEILDLSAPSDVVALRDGRILWMEVRSGQRLVMNGEAVTAGTRLITGRVTSDMGEKLYRAYGTVWAETQRQITVSVPLLEVTQEPTGQGILRPTWTFLCWDIPLYSDGPLPEGLLHRRQTWFLTVKGMRLPLGVARDWYLYTRQVKTARTPAQTAALAAEQLRREEQELFGEGVYTELSRSGALQGDAYVLTAVYRCEEDIGVEVPLDGALPASP